ncbi:MAG: LEA type 2 family protein [Solirubrobacterales bacterium]
MARVLIVGAFLAVLAGCESVEERMSLRKPDAQITGMRLQDADAYGATVVFDVQIVNHYPMDLPLVRFSYAVSSQGKRFMGGAQEVAVTIPVGGSQTVSLPARIDYINTLRLLGGVRPGATIPYEAQLDLTINTPRLGTIMLPLARSGEVTLPTLAGADVDKLLGGGK